MRKKKEGGKGTYQGWGLGFFCLVGRGQRRKGKVSWWLCGLANTNYKRCPWGRTGQCGWSLRGRACREEAPETLARHVEMAAAKRQHFWSQYSATQMTRFTLPTRCCRTLQTPSSVAAKHVIDDCRDITETLHRCDFSLSSIR